MIKTVTDVQPHPDADRLDIAYIEGVGYPFVCAKGLSIGDLVHHIPEGFTVSDRLKEELDLKSNKVKVTRLRGQLSYGMLIPVDQLTVEEGDIFKVEDPEHTKSRRKLPKGVDKYDIENAQNDPELLAQMLKEPIVVTEKLEGTNCSVAIIEGQFYVNSRNRNVPEDDSVYWGVVRQQKLFYLAKFIGGNVILRGEIIGPNIQGNIYDLSAPEFRLFDIEHEGKFMDHKEYSRYTDYCLHVPTLFEGKTTDVNHLINGKSCLADTLREGIVIKTQKGRNILKYRSPEYLSK